MEHQPGVDFLVLGHRRDIAPRAPARFAFADGGGCVVARIAQQPIQTARLDGAFDDPQPQERLTNAFDKMQSRDTGKITPLEQGPAHFCVLAPFFGQQHEIIVGQHDLGAAQHANAQIGVTQARKCQRNALAQCRTGGHDGEHVRIARADDPHEIGIEQHREN